MCMRSVELQIIRKGVRESKCLKDYRLYYGLSGECIVTWDEGKAVIRKGEALAFNPDERHSIDCRGIVACLEIGYSEMLRLTGYRKRWIVCNTCGNRNENAQELAKTIERLMKASYEGTYRDLLVEKYSLDLVFLLVANYSNNIFSHVDTRKEEIEGYIEGHFRDDLSLDNIAEEFGVTPQYFSRYFKDSFDITFLKYLNGVRLRHAAEELLKNDWAVLRVAMDNGFPNASSFLREFKNAYGMTPNEFRKNNQQTEDVKEDLDILKLLSEALEEDNGALRVVEIDDEKECGLLDEYWTNIVNLASMTILMKSGVMEQADQMIKDLKFKRARITLDAYDNAGKHNFYVVDKTMGFFVSRQMDVILVIDYRGIDDQESYLTYFKEQCIRLSRKFGMAVQSHTSFEILYNTEYTKEKLESYHRFRKEVEEIAKAYRFTGPVVGPGMLVDESDDNFRRFARAAKEMEAITIEVAPYAIHRKNGEVFINQVTDSGYVKEQYDMAQRIMREEGCLGELWIVSWKDRLNDVDVLNETSYMGARIIRSVLEGYGVYKSLPLNMPLDLLMDETVFAKTFNGLSGVMTVNGIQKPSYHAYKFLNRQDRLLVKVDNGYLITKSDNRGFYQILCHNNKKPGYRYYAMETVMEYSDDLFEDTTDTTFRFVFRNLNEGDYLLKKRYVSNESGCAYLKYKKLKYVDDSYIGIGENRFLKASAEPEMSGEILHVGKNGDLVIECTLKMNAFAHLHLLPIG